MWSPVLSNGSLWSNKWRLQWILVQSEHNFLPDDSCCLLSWLKLKGDLTKEAQKALMQRGEREKSYTSPALLIMIGITEITKQTGVSCILTKNSQDKEPSSLHFFKADSVTKQNLIKWEQCSAVLTVYLRNGWILHRVQPCWSFCSSTKGARSDSTILASICNRYSNTDTVQ